MRNCLILLVNGFPFMGGEDFLLRELPILSERFERIFIFARDVNRTAQPCRQIPHGAQAAGLSRINDAAQKRLQKLMGAASAVFCPAPDKQADTFAKKAFCSYFELRAQDGFKVCRSALADVDFGIYDNVVIYSYWFFVTARIGAKLKEWLESRNANVRLISRAHRYDLYAEANELSYLPMRKSLLDSSDGVYACSADGLDYLKDQYPEYEHKLHMSILGAADMGECNHSRVDGFNIVTCSVAAPRKRLDRVASALKKLDGEPELRLRWTHMGDGEELEKIKNYSSAFKNIDARFTGAVSNDEVYEFYKNNSVNLFVNVSDSEGLPVSVMEAESFGIPCVVTDVGGSAQAVKDGVTGFVIPQDFDDEDLAAVIRGLAVCDEEKYLSMCRQSHEQWDRLFNAQKNYSEFWDNILPSERA